VVSDLGIPPISIVAAQYSSLLWEPYLSSSCVHVFGSRSIVQPICGVRSVLAVSYNTSVSNSHHETVCDKIVLQKDG
jgi:hypothetical protein